jgi:hypothetical protein
LAVVEPAPGCVVCSGGLDTAGVWLVGNAGEETAVVWLGGDDDGTPAADVCTAEEEGEAGGGDMLEAPPESVDVDCTGFPESVGVVCTEFLESVVEVMSAVGVVDVSDVSGGAEVLEGAADEVLEVVVSSVAFFKGTGQAAAAMPPRVTG